MSYKDLTGNRYGRLVVTVRRPRRAKRAALSLPVDLHDNLNAARQRAGLSWPAFLSRVVEE